MFCKFQGLAFEQAKKTEGVASWVRAQACLVWFPLQADMAGRDFTAERSHVIVVSTGKRALEHGYMVCVYCVCVCTYVLVFVCVYVCVCVCVCVCECLDVCVSRAFISHICALMCIHVFVICASHMTLLA